MICIPLKTWMSWTDEERGEVLTYFEAKGKKWYIDFTEEENYQKDKDEYREEMSLGGRKISEY
jgi:hypothetical protein